jgi:hypothetical protein
MHQGQIRVIVAVVILGGHFLVFFCGLLLGVFGPLLGSDAVQTVLMASPVLGVTATAALMFALRGEVGIHRGRKVSGLFALVTIFFPSALIACVFVVFYAVYVQVPGFGPEQMKIALGGIETFFGVFLGAISDTLFGRKEDAAKDSTPAPGTRKRRSGAGQGAAEDRIKSAAP